jgi:hypothetical protein
MHDESTKERKNRKGVDKMESERYYLGAFVQRSDKLVISPPYASVNALPYVKLADIQTGNWSVYLHRNQVIFQVELIHEAEAQGVTDFAHHVYWRTRIKSSVASLGIFDANYHVDNWTSYLSPQFRLEALHASLYEHGIDIFSPDIPYYKIGMPQEQYNRGEIQSIILRGRLSKS